MQRTSREQLPPLSSIFPGSQAGGSVPSSYTNQSPKFAAAPPPHPHHPPAPTHQEHQSWDSTYSRPLASQSNSFQYSYDSRPAQSPNTELPSPPRPIQGSQAPNSPRYYDHRYSPKSALHTQAPLQRADWLPRNEGGAYRDYFPPISRDTSSSFRPQSGQHNPMPLQPRTKEAENGSFCRDSSLSIPSATRLYSPGGTTAPDSVTTKDGLGPKIWTGTQFLPRFVRQAEIPGEGLCYFYDDGTHCKTHIDGEAVNAHWGVTKAGKPRKRLAIACITCREKKIKCDPDYPRCIQCEKFGRVCKFKNA